MDGNKELKLRLTMDNSDLLKKDEQAEHANKRMTDAASEGMKKYGADSQKATDKAATGMQGVTVAAKDTGKEMLNLIKAQIGLSAVKQTAGAIVQQFNEASVRIESMAKQFQKLRADMNSVASLSGQPNTNKFALSEVEKAEKANVMPEEAKDFRDAFLAKASLYVGEGKNAKMSDADSDEFQQAMMEYAKQKGVSQQEMAGFAGGLLAQQKGKTTSKEMISRAGKVFATLEASSAPVGHLLPEMTRTMAGGMTAEEAAPTLAAMPEIAPGEEGTYLARAVQVTRELNLKERGGEFGMSKGQSQYEQLKALVKNLEDRSKKGEDLDKILADIAPEQVSSRALRGLVGQGKEGFERWRGVLDNTSDDAVKTSIEAGRKTETGRQAAVDAALAAEQARMGARNDALAKRRQIAELELTKSGAFEHVPLSQRTAAAINPFGDDLRTQQINRQAIGRARAELGEGMGPRDAFASTSRGLTDEVLRELIPRIEARRAQGRLAGQFGKDQEGPNGKGANQAGADKGAGNGEMVDLMKKQNQLLEEQNKLMRDKQNTVRNGPPPALPSKPTPIPTRP